MKMNEKMKKAISILLCVLMLVQYVPTYAFAADAAEDVLCAHHTEHTAECGYVAGSEGSPCTYNCQEDHGTVPSEQKSGPGGNGEHVYDASCLVCQVAEMINALPTKIDINNAAAVTEQLHAIDRVKYNLSDDQYEELLTLVDQGDNGSGGGLGVPVRYMEAVEAVTNLTGCGSVDITKVWVSTDGEPIDASDTTVQFAITNVNTKDTQTLTMSTMGYQPYSLSSDPEFYSENTDGSGWTYKYWLPAGTYTITETEDAGAADTTYQVGNNKTHDTASFTITEGEGTVVVAANMARFPSFTVKVFIPSGDGETSEQIGGEDVVAPTNSEGNDSVSYDSTTQCFTYQFVDYTTGASSGSFTVNYTGNTETKYKEETVAFEYDSAIGSFSYTGNNENVKVEDNVFSVFLTPHAHDWADGFCTVCGGFQPAEDTDNDGYYEVDNAGKLFWFAYQMNVEFKNELKIKLTDDIDLENREWTPIGINSGAYADQRHYVGHFDGQGHTISNFKMTIESGGDYGLFCIITSGAVVENFSIDGEVTINTADTVNYGVVCNPSKSTVRNVHSSIDLTVAEDCGSTSNKIGGIVGYTQKNYCPVTVDRCSFSGTMDLGSNPADVVGGIVAYVEAGGEATITNCGFYGEIKSTRTDGANQMGGIMGYYRGTGLTLQNCLSVGTITASNSSLSGLVMGRLLEHTSANTKVTNNYYTGTQPFGDADDSRSIVKGNGGQTVAGSATQVTTDQLSSGEIAYKLGEAWGQTIGEDEHPVLGGAAVYYGYTSCEDDAEASYTNNSSASDEPILHTREYSLEDGVIIEICTVCENELGTAKLIAEGGTYNGGAYAASVEKTGTLDVEIPVTYAQDGETLESAPEDAGTYTASITYGGVDVSKEFTIAPKELTLLLDPFTTHKYYDGSSVLTNFDSVYQADVEVQGKADYLDNVSVDETLLTVELSDCKPGTYFSAKVSGITLTGWDADNYTIASVIENVPFSGYYTIDTGYLIITPEDQFLAASADPDQTAYTVVGLPEGHTLSGVKLEKIKDDESDEDVYIIKVNPDEIVITNADGDDVTEYFEIDTEDTGKVTTACEGHTFNEYGFCASGGCEVYEPAKKTVVADEYGNATNGCEISNAGQLYWYAQQLKEGLEIYAKLTADITIPESYESTGGETVDVPDWMPINCSTVHFDGNFKTISGLRCTDSNAYDVGLFGDVSWWSQISNLHITNSQFEGKDDVGAVAADLSNNGGSVTNCYVTNTTVKGGGYVGGLVGNVAYNTVENCYSTATVTATADGAQVGAVVGRIGSDATVTNCYYLSDTDNGEGGKTAAQFASGEVAYLLNGASSEGVWKQNLGENDTDASPNFTGAKVYRAANTGCRAYGEYGYINTSGVTSVAMPHSFGADGFCVNKQSDGTTCGGYQPADLNEDTYDLDGDGTKDAIYEIGNAGQLYWFAALINGDTTAVPGIVQNKSANAVLTKNIVVNADVLKADGTLNGDGSNFRTWTPIGCYKSNKDNATYTGTFDGKDFTVSGLYFNDSNTDYVGLFGYVDEGGTVENVGVVASYIHGDGYVGGVVGNNYGTVANSYNTGTVTGSYMMVGGVVGENNYTGTVTNSYNTGTITGFSEVGGVVGHNPFGTITNCYNIGAVSAYGHVGGVVGENLNGTVENCYNTGSVAGSGFYVGGVVGYNYGGTVTNCYYLDKVDDTTNPGGINGADVEGQAEVKTEDQFKSGEVAYKLSQGCTVGEGDAAVEYSGDVWKQDIDTDNTPDAYPNFTGAKVYQITNTGCQAYGANSYSNTATTVYAPAHIYGDATCEAPATCSCGETTGSALGHKDDNKDHNCDNGCEVFQGEHKDSADDKDHVCDYGCGATLEACYGGKATCVEKAKCAACGNYYGELAGHNWVDGVCVNGCNTPHEPHDWSKQDGKCATCGFICDHTDETGTCMICGKTDCGPTRPDAGTLGDLDLDGDVDAEDLTILARHVAGIEKLTDDTALENADVDGSGEITAEDLTLHARYVAGIITSWDQT